LRQAPIADDRRGKTEATRPNDGDKLFYGIIPAG